MTDDLTNDTSRPPLRRDESTGMLAGVASGLAEYLDLDVTLVRVGMVALALLGGAGVPLYLAAWLLIPERNEAASVAEQLLHRHRAA